MDYFADNFKKLKIARFYLVTPFPGGAENLSQVLKNEFSMPVDSGRLFPLTASVNSAVAATASYGLTLSSSDKGGARKINLKGADATTAAPVAALSWEEEKKKLQDLAIAVILGLVVLIAVAYFTLSGMIHTKKIELQRATLQYPKAESVSISEPIEALQTKQTEVQQKIAYYAKIFDQRVYVTPKMNALAKLVPANIQLQQLSFNNEISAQGSSVINLRIVGRVLASGSANETTVLNKLVSQLSGNKEFMAGIDEIKIVSTQRSVAETSPGMKFTLDCSTRKT
jgi:Tfp pilus assembly protein PilN